MIHPCGHTHLYFHHGRLQSRLNLIQVRYLTVKVIIQVYIAKQCEHRLFRVLVDSLSGILHLTSHLPVIIGSCPDPSLHREAEEAQQALALAVRELSLHRQVLLLCPKGRIHLSKDAIIRIPLPYLISKKVARGIKAILPTSGGGCLSGALVLCHSCAIYPSRVSRSNAFSCFRSLSRFYLCFLNPRSFAFHISLSQSCFLRCHFQGIIVPCSNRPV